MRAPFRPMLLLTAVGLVTACSGSADPGAALSTPSPSTPACESFPIEQATALLTDPATGEQRVPGEVDKAVSVQSPSPGPDGSTVHVIAIDLDGKSFVLIHPVTDGSGAATGDGPYASVNSNTAVATGVPEDREVEALAGNAPSLAVRCLTSDG